MKAFNASIYFITAFYVRWMLSKLWKIANKIGIVIICRFSLLVSLCPYPFVHQISNAFSVIFGLVSLVNRPHLSVHMSGVVSISETLHKKKLLFFLFFFFVRCYWEIEYNKWLSVKRMNSVIPIKIAWVVNGDPFIFTHYKIFLQIVTKKKTNHRFWNIQHI